MRISRGCCFDPGVPVARCLQRGAAALRASARAAAHRQHLQHQSGLRPPAKAAPGQRHGADPDSRRQVADTGPGGWRPRSRRRRRRHDPASERCRGTHAAGLAGTGAPDAASASPPDRGDAAAGPGKPAPARGEDEIPTQGEVESLYEGVMLTYSFDALRACPWWAPSPDRDIAQRIEVCPNPESRKAAFRTV